MPELSLQDVRRIAANQGFPQISIHTPMETAGREVEQNRVRLKNAISDAAEKLRAHDLSDSEIDSLLQPVAALSESSAEMQRQQGGLSLFVTSDGYDEIQLPVQSKPRVEVGTYPLVLPLLEPSTQNRDYLLLTLSLGGVGLYRATRFTLEQIDLPDLPEDLCYVLRYDEFEKSLQPHSTSRGGEAGGVHGHGAGKDEHDRFVSRFVDSVTAVIRPIFEREQLPVVLVGNEEAVGRFAADINYAHLVEPHNHVDPHTLSAQQLLESGWKTMETLINNDREEALERVRSSENHAVGVHGVLSAINEGRAATVCLDPAREIPGSFDPKTSEVHVARNGDTGVFEDLSNVIACEALRMGVPLIVTSTDDMELPRAIVRT